MILATIAAGVLFCLCLFLLFSNSSQARNVARLKDYNERLFLNLHTHVQADRVITAHLEHEQKISKRSYDKIRLAVATDSVHLLNELPAARKAYLEFKNDLPVTV